MHPLPSFNCHFLFPLVQTTASVRCCWNNRPRRHSRSNFKFVFRISFPLSFLPSDIGKWDVSDVCALRNEVPWQRIFKSSHVIASREFSEEKLLLAPFRAWFSFKTLRRSYRLVFTLFLKWKRRTEQGYLVCKQNLKLFHFSRVAIFAPCVAVKKTIRHQCFSEFQLEDTKPNERSLFRHWKRLQWTTHACLIRFELICIVDFSGELNGNYFERGGWTPVVVWRFGKSSWIALHKTCSLSWEGKRILQELSKQLCSAASFQIMELTYELLKGEKFSH